MMNLFSREIISNLKSLIIWCFGMIIMVGGGIAKYAGYSTAGESITKLLDGIPQSIKAVLGFRDFDVTTVIGFYGVLHLYVVIMTSIHASVIGATIIAKEERDKTAEFLLTKPLSRPGILTAKLLAALANILALNIFTCVMSMAFIDKYAGGGSYKGEVSLLMTGMFVIQLIFMLIGAAIAATTRKPRLAASLSSGIMLAAFLLFELVLLNEKLDFLKYFTPFKYFDAADILMGEGINPSYIILSMVMVAGFVFAIYRNFLKRDLKV